MIQQQQQQQQQQQKQQQQQQQQGHQGHHGPKSHKGRKGRKSRKSPKGLKGPKGPKGSSNIWARFLTFPPQLRNMNASQLGSRNMDIHHHSFIHSQIFEQKIMGHRFNMMHHTLHLSCQNCPRKAF